MKLYDYGKWVCFVTHFKSNIMQVQEWLPVCNLTPEKYEELLIKYRLDLGYSNGRLSLMREILPEKYLTIRNMCAKNASIAQRLER